MTPSPLGTLLDVLRERQDAGHEFGDAWADAVQAALADVHDLAELKQWRQAHHRSVVVGNCESAASTRRR
jgi:hypothetical protein